MCEGEPKDNIEARSLVWRLFRDAADEDYLVARHSISIDLHFQFAWSAQQAIEKYLKCALLLNGISVQNSGHDILKMFDELTKIADGLFPTVFVPPRGFPLNHGSFHRRVEPYRDFIIRISQMGDPNSRYRYYSIVVDKFDLHKLDETCFQLRRLCIPMDMIFKGPDVSFRVALQSDPNMQVHGLAFGFQKNDKVDDERLNLLRRRNFSFFPKEAYESGTIEDGGRLYNSPIYLALQRPKHASEALLWLLDNAYFNRNDRDDIKKYINGA
jgi:hypothetical protein